MLTKYLTWLGPKTKNWLDLKAKIIHTYIHTSHTRTVVRECCKDDDQSQRERPKFDPSQPLNPLTDRFQIYLCDYDVDNYYPAKFHADRIRSFVSAHARFRASNCLLGYLIVFFGGGGSSNRLQWRRPHGFWRKIRQKMRFRARMCLLGVAKPKVELFTLFCPKNRHFGALNRHRSSIKVV